MSRVRVKVLYSGHVQGVGFRYTVRNEARGFDVAGVVRNLPNGKVEMVAEGERPELNEFLKAITESGLGSLISDTEIEWGEAAHGFRGFEIVS